MSMKQTHEGIEIEYNEDDNRWHFELRGRKRNAESLAKAKEAIEKEPPEKRKQTFPRFEAYNITHWDDWQIVTVTSMADNDYSGKPQFWVQDAKGKRAKKRDIYPVNEHNTGLRDEILKIETEIKRHEKLKAALMGKLKAATVPKELA